jgi:hypothetical protein
MEGVAVGRRCVVECVGWLDLQFGPIPQLFAFLDEAGFGASFSAGVPQAVQEILIIKTNCLCNEVSIHNNLRPPAFVHSKVIYLPTQAAALQKSCAHYTLDF